MLCNRCQKAQATYHITDIDPSGEKFERHLCDRCAIEEGVQPADKPATAVEVLDKFVLGGKTAGALQNLVCENCGTSYIEFRNQGLLGCPQDYDTFKDVLGPLVERAHDGGTHHVGKTPRSMGVERTTEQDIRRLKRMLDEAVSAEDYERAATLRDKLREAEEQ